MPALYYSTLPEALSEKAFQDYLQSVPKAFSISIQSIKNKESREASLLGKLLLKQALEDLASNVLSLNDVELSAYKRPSIKGSIDFNISHSGKYVLCAVSDSMRIGVDIEEVLPVNFTDFKRVLHPKEWEIIQESAEPLASFYEIWTRKEAAVKADGRGFNLALEKVLVEENTVSIEKQNWYTKTLDLHKNYAAAIASAEAIDSIDLRYIDFG